jgi:hypothetical protein
MAYPTLEDINKTYKNLAKAGAPVKTGRLRDSIVSSYQKLSDTTYKFDLNMVSYGMWWNEPPQVVKRVKLAARPEFNFANRAAEDQELQKVIDDYFKADILVTVTEKMQKAFDKGGYKKLRQSFGR